MYDFVLLICFVLHTVPTPTVTISPSGPIQGAIVDNSLVINCTVNTVSGVESNSVIINWRGPGNIATSSGRIFSIGSDSVIDDGNNMYTRSLQFTYLMEGDEGTYTCNVMILGISGSQSVELQSLTGKLHITHQLNLYVFRNLDIVQYNYKRHQFQLNNC